MQVKIHTAPVKEAFTSGDECPFCALERQSQEYAIRFVAGPGASYMEPEVRAVTNRLGFCRWHMKSLYDYGNSLGNALMLQSYLDEFLEEFHGETGKNTAERPRRRPLRRMTLSGAPDYTRLEQKMETCYLCQQVEESMERYYLTFFHLVRDEEFREIVETGKGFCVPHFARLLRMAEKKLPSGQQDWFYDRVVTVMEENLRRVKGDLDWLIAKNDYRNAGADWRNSRDALQRTMQKLTGGHPAAPPYRKE